MPEKRRGELGAGAGMDTIAATIERLIQAEYGRPAPPHFQRAARELLRHVSGAMRESLSKAVETGEARDLSRSAVAHFPLADWDWEAPPGSALTTKVKHFGRELPLLVSPLPDAFTSDMPSNTYLALARGAVHRYSGPGPGPSAYHLYLAPEHLKELKRRRTHRRDFFISSRYVPYQLYKTSWPISAGDIDFTRELTVGLGPIQIQDEKKWAHIVVVFYVSTNRTKPPKVLELLENEERGEIIIPPDPSAEELIAALAKLETVLAGEETEPAQPGQMELIPHTKPKSFDAPAHFMEQAHKLGRWKVSSTPDGILKKHPLFDGYDSELVAGLIAQQEAGSIRLCSGGDNLIAELNQGPLFPDEPKVIGEDAAKMGELSTDLGALGMRVYLALLKIAKRQRGMTQHPGKIILRNWNELCREVYPDFDWMEKPAQDACRRRVKLAVAIMYRIKLYYSYRRPAWKQVRDKSSRTKKWVRLTEEHFVAANWVSKWENIREGNRKSHRTIIVLGVYDDDYTVAIAEQSLALLADKRMSENAQLLFSRLLRETWLEKNMTVAKLIEWGAWKSKDHQQNRASLADALALFVELGYYKEAKLLPDGERYHLVRHPDYCFPAKGNEEAEKAYPGSGEGDKPEGGEAEKAYSGREGGEGGNP